MGEKKEISNDFYYYIKDNIGSIPNSQHMTDNNEQDETDDPKIYSPHGITINPFNPKQTYPQFLKQIDQNLNSNRRLINNLSDLNIAQGDGNRYNRTVETTKNNSRKMKQIRESEGVQLADNNFVTHKELQFLEDSIDLKITSAIAPLDAKIDNLPTSFENLLLKERQYQDDKRKETNRFIVGTIVLGGFGLLSGILMPIIMHFATN